MKSVCRIVFAAAICAWLPVSAGAAPQGPPAQDPKAAQKPDQKPTPKPDGQKPDEQKPQTYEETVVVSASKTEEKLINAPATMTVVGPRQIETAPSQNFAELLRRSRA